MGNLLVRRIFAIEVNMKTIPSRFNQEDYQMSSLAHNYIERHYVVIGQPILSCNISHVQVELY